MNEEEELRKAIIVTCGVLIGMTHRDFEDPEKIKTELLRLAYGLGKIVGANQLIDDFFAQKEEGNKCEKK